MNVVIENQPVTLDDQDLLGVGGEARVYRWQDLAVKVYQASSTAGGSSVSAAPDPAHLQLRALKLRAFPIGLPPEVVGPVALAFDAAGRSPVGFAMRAIQGAQDFRKLSSRTWRDGVVSNAEVTALLKRLHGVLDALHARGVVVGDLNDANVLFSGADLWLIDADSMQFGAFPCQVGHERFIDPRLYGLDLSQAPAFTPDSDWYAFAVLLFSSLLYVHPYGGIHSRHPNLLRRAEARCSVLRPDVKYPKAATHFQVLPDDLLAWLEAVFEHDRRGRLPEGLLHLQWVRCACGVEHARPACPACATMRPLAPRMTTQHHGRCQAAVVFSTTTGRILLAVVQGGLRYLYQEAGTLRREDGSIVAHEALDPGMRFGISGRTTWLARGGKLTRFDNGSATERLACGSFGPEPAFDSSSSQCVRAEGGWLVDCMAGRRLGQVLDGQTWFRLGETLGFGFYRVGRLTVYFVVDPRRGGLRQVVLPSISGRLLEASATFDERHVLFQVSSEKDGRVLNRLYVITAGGEVIARLEGAPDSARALASLDGKVIVGDRILCATDQGLLSLEVDPVAGVVVEGGLFADTEPFIREGATLLAGPGGSVYVVTTREITELRLIR